MCEAHKNYKEHVNRVFYFISSPYIHTYHYSLVNALNYTGLKSADFISVIGFNVKYKSFHHSPGNRITDEHPELGLLLLLLLSRVRLRLLADSHCRLHCPGQTGVGDG